MLNRIKQLILNRASRKIMQSPEEFGEGLAAGLSEITNNILKLIYSYDIEMTEDEIDRMEQALMLVYIMSIVAAITSSDEIHDNLKKKVVGYFEQSLILNLLERKENYYIHDLKNKLHMWSQRFIELIITPPEQSTLNVGRFLLKVAFGDMSVSESSKFNDPLLISKLTSDFCIAVNISTEYVTDVLTTYAVVEN